MFAYLYMLSSSSIYLFSRVFVSFFFFFNDTATTEIYTLSLHDALPIFQLRHCDWLRRYSGSSAVDPYQSCVAKRSEEHTSELQSQSNLVCRLLLEKKKKKHTMITISILSIV